MDDTPSEDTPVRIECVKVNESCTVLKVWLRGSSNFYCYNVALRPGEDVSFREGQDNGPPQYRQKIARSIEVIRNAFGQFGEE